MAGVSVQIAYDDGGVMEMFALLIQFGQNPEPALKGVGEYLLIRTEDRFDAETGPGGIEWLELKPATRALKRHSKILTEESRLRDSFAYQAAGNELDFGTNVIYAAVHQFGFDDRGIPARPFVGLDDEDEAEIVAVLGDYLEELAGGRGPAG